MSAAPMFIGSTTGAGLYGLDGSTTQLKELVLFTCRNNSLTMKSLRMESFGKSYLGVGLAILPDQAATASEQRGMCSRLP